MEYLWHNVIIRLIITMINRTYFMKLLSAFFTSGPTTEPYSKDGHDFDADGA